MPGKEPEPIFRRPRFNNAEDFVKTGTLEQPAPPPAPVPLAGPEAPIREAEAPRPQQASPANISQKSHVEQKPRKVAMTYKHKQDNYEYLKWLSQRINPPRNMGQLIDEALEAMFAEWRKQVPSDVDSRF